MDRALSKATLAIGVVVAVAMCGPSHVGDKSAPLPTGAGAASDDRSAQALAEGQRVFRYETFGDEQFWTDTARMQEVVQSGVSPNLALQVGLKVDAGAIPPAVAQAIKDGQVDLNSPATTVTLLKLNAVVGLRGTVTTIAGKDTL